MDSIAEIFDDNGKPLKIGQRVGCRQAGESREWSRRGLTLLGYNFDSERPYITNIGAFTHAILDHQPEMDQWIAENVR